MSKGLLLLFALGAVLGAALFTVRGSGRVESAANNVIANARQILDASAAHEHDRVLLQVVTDARDVRGDLFAVRQPHARHFAQRGVRLLRRDGLNLRANAAPLRIAAHLEGARRQIGVARFGAGQDDAERARLDLLLGLLAPAAHELIDCRNGLCSSYRAWHTKHGLTRRWDRASTIPRPYFRVKC